MTQIPEWQELEQDKYFAFMYKATLWLFPGLPGFEAQLQAEKDWQKDIEFDVYGTYGLSYEGFSVSLLDLATSCTVNPHAIPGPCPLCQVGSLVLLLPRTGWLWRQVPGVPAAADQAIAGGAADLPSPNLQQPADARRLLCDQADAREDQVARDPTGHARALLYPAEGALLRAQSKPMPCYNAGLY